MMHFEIQMLNGKHVIIDQPQWTISQFSKMNVGMITRLKLTKDGKTDYYGGEIIELTQINEIDGIIKMIERPNMHLHDPSKSK